MTVRAQKRTRNIEMVHESGETAQKPLKGKTALVTGASQGVGKGISLALAHAGCAVAINFRTDPEMAAETVSAIRMTGADAFAIKADIRSSTQVKKMFGAIAGHFAKLDVLINNAGTQTWAPFLELNERDWDRDIETNLRGTFLCTQAAGNWMKDTGGGSIINIGSGCNKVPFPKLVSYTASKGGVDMLTKVAATELGRYKIRVNCVAPGAILIDRTQNEDPHYASVWGKEAPIGRVGLPEDVGNACVFLASEQSSFVSGQTIWIDGGAFTKPSWPYKLQENEASRTVTRKRRKAG